MAVGMSQLRSRALIVRLSRVGPSSRRLRRTGAHGSDTVAAGRRPDLDVPVSDTDDPAATRAREVAPLRSWADMRREQAAPDPPTQALTLKRDVPLGDRRVAATAAGWKDWLRSSTLPTEAHPKRCSTRSVSLRSASPGSPGADSGSRRRCQRRSDGGRRRPHLPAPSSTHQSPSNPLSQGRANSSSRERTRPVDLVERLPLPRQSPPPPANTRSIRWPTG